MGASDREKLDACLEATLRLAAGDLDYKAASALLRQRLGSGWTGVSAMQWLTGKKAWSLIETLSTAGTPTSPREVALELVQFAAHVCEDAGVNGAAEDALERVRVNRVAKALR